jgi:AcrR family transcriptional regulator
MPGRRPLALDERKAGLDRQLYAEKKLTIDEVCKAVGVSRPTLYRYIRKTS